MSGNRFTGWREWSIKHPTTWAAILREGCTMDYQDNLWLNGKMLASPAELPGSIIEDAFRELEQSTFFTQSRKKTVKHREGHTPIRSILPTVVALRDKVDEMTIPFGELTYADNGAAIKRASEILSDIRNKYLPAVAEALASCRKQGQQAKEKSSNNQ